jgi:NADH pyrophosphatase NudC (nudix superfamily)
MTIALACLITVGVLAFILSVRAKDLPQPEPVSPFQHLDERKAAIYENLRDLQFEYRVGKLSDHDYQQTKLDLQRELAGVMAEIDRVKGEIAAGKIPAPAPELVKTAPTPTKGPAKYVCPSCQAEFSQPLKFCGECGKPMKAAEA